MGAFSLFFLPFFFSLSFFLSPFFSFLSFPLFTNTPSRGSNEKPSDVRFSNGTRDFVETTGTRCFHRFKPPFRAEPLVPPSNERSNARALRAPVNNEILLGEAVLEMTRLRCNLQFSRVIFINAPRLVHSARADRAGRRLVSPRFLHRYRLRPSVCSAFWDQTSGKRALNSMIMR